ncbi:MAG: hypothetical protein U9O83_00340 [Campylobacterota bacterium]|nr:hypothetical protein [Campylobacterota bacterium]
MEKIVLLIFSAVVLLCANEDALSKCSECHTDFLAPPYKKVYKHYLLKYSSKARVKKAMIDFLSAPTSEKSAMPRGMKKRFNPDEHLVFDGEIAQKAVESLIEREDIIKRLRVSP